MGFWQIGIIEEYRIFSHVHRNTGNTRTGDISHDALFSNAQPVIALEHSQSACAVRGTQDCEFLGIVEQENPNVVKTESFTYHRCDTWQEIAKITDGRDCLRYLCKCLKLGGT